jgi:hypothetical protein
MKNLAFSIEDNTLIIKIDLSQDHGLSRSGRSRIVSTSGGNLRLFDTNGFRNEKLNFTLSREIDKDKGRS